MGEAEDAAEPSPSARGHAFRGFACRQVDFRCKFGFDDGRELRAQRGVGRDHLRHPRRDMVREQSVDHLAEIDAEVLDAHPARHGEVGRHADQEFVQREALWPKCDELVDVEPGEIAQLTRRGETGPHVLGAEQRGQCQQLARQLRLDPGIPGTEFLRRRVHPARRRRMHAFVTTSRSKEARPARPLVLGAEHRDGNFG